MPKMQCPTCGTEIPGSGEFCLSCAHFSNMNGISSFQDDRMDVDQPRRLTHPHQRSAAPYNTGPMSQNVVRTQGGWYHQTDGIMSRVVQVEIMPVRTHIPVPAALPPQPPPGFFPATINIPSYRILRTMHKIIRFSKRVFPCDNTSFDHFKHQVAKILLNEFGTFANKCVAWEIINSSRASKFFKTYFYLDTTLTLTCKERKGLGQKKLTLTESEQLANRIWRMATKAKPFFRQNWG